MTKHEINIVKRCGVVYIKIYLRFETALPLLFGNDNISFKNVECGNAGDKRQGTSDKEQEKKNRIFFQTKIFTKIIDKETRNKSQ